MAYKGKHLDEIYEVRRDNVLSVIATQFEGSRSLFADKLGFGNKSFVSRLVNGRQKIGSRLARKIERQCNLVPNSLDHQVRKEGSADEPGENLLVRPYRRWPSDSPIENGLVLSMAWIKANLPYLTSPLNLRTMIGADDAMETTLHKGDIALIDVGIDYVAEQDIYVIAIDRAEYVRRVQRRIDGGYTALSDNRNYIGEAISAEDLFSVKARVVWIWNGRKP